MRKSFSISGTPRFVVSSVFGKPKETVMVEAESRRALKAAGFPDDLAGATPAQSRWGTVVSHEVGKKILGIA